MSTEDWTKLINEPSSEKVPWARQTINITLASAQAQLAIELAAKYHSMYWEYCCMYKFKIFSFNLKVRMTEREQTQREFSCVLIHSLNSSNSQVKASNSTQSSHVNQRDPITWAIFGCLPRRPGRQLYQTYTDTPLRGAELATKSLMCCTTVPSLNHNPICLYPIHKWCQTMRGSMFTYLTMPTQGLKSKSKTTTCATQTVQVITEIWGRRYRLIFK